MLIIFAGLPGTGKTTIARELARRAGALYLRIDTIEWAMAKSSLRISPAEDAGYCAAYGIAEDNLKLGNAVVADAVNPIAETRNAWLAVAERAGCAGVDVEVVCSNREEHRRRVEARPADRVGGRRPTWQDVLERDYHPWTRDRIVVDTAGVTPDQCVELVLARLLQ